MSVKDELSPREAAFVEALLSGKDGKPMPAGRAYEAAGYKAKGGVADTNASRLLRNAKVAAKIKQRRREMAEACQIEKWQLVDFLSRALLTPVGEVDETSDLAQEVTTDEVGEAVLRKKIKSVGKIEAGKLLATLLNWTEPEKHEVKFEVVIGGNADA